MPVDDDYHSSSGGGTNHNNMIDESYDSAMASALLIPTKNTSSDSQQQLPAAGLSTVESQRSYRRRANKNIKRCEAMVASVKLSQGTNDLNNRFDESYGQHQKIDVPEHSDQAHISRRSQLPDVGNSLQASNNM